MIILCAVCFRGADPLMRESLNAGILVLLAVTAVVLGSFAYFFVQLARRAKGGRESFLEDTLPAFPADGVLHK